MGEIGDLRDALHEARALGLLGPGPIGTHIDHADELVTELKGHGVDVGSRCLDLGSGGGVPGIVLAVREPASRWTLLDAAERRTAFLQRVVSSLDLGDRVEVVRGRAEVVARDSVHRGVYDLVTARSFGPPAVTVECAAGFLAPGGWLAVSEPPIPDPARWPESGMRALGLEVVSTGSWMLARLVLPVPDDVPRRDGVPRKRPRW